MTLVVARRTKNSIVLVGDTRLGDSARGLAIPALGGVIKTLALTPYFAVSFAGNALVAGKAIHTCYEEWLGFTVDTIVRGFLDVHLEHHESPDMEVEFIVTFSNPTEESRLFVIKDGGLVDTDVAWIGDNAGFAAYQEAFHDPDPKHTMGIGTAAFDMAKDSGHPDEPDGLLREMRRAMQAVINDAKVPSVGGFVIPMASTRQAFQYMDYFYAQTGPMDLSDLYNLEDMPNGSAQEGHYSVHFGSAQNKDAFQFPFLYFTEGGFGAIFGHHGDGLLRAEKFSATSFEQFAGLIRKEGLNPRTRMKNAKAMTAFLEKGSLGTLVRDLELKSKSRGDQEPPEGGS